MSDDAHKDLPVLSPQVWWRRRWLRILLRIASVPLSLVIGVALPLWIAELTDSGWQLVHGGFLWLPLIALFSLLYLNFLISMACRELP